MAGYSKESERQNKALKSILRGETPEKRVQVGYNGDKDGKAWEKQGDKIDRLSEIMKEVRMPWFCPECKKTMKNNLDDKMWRLFGHCFDCQVTIENKLRIKGEYEEWEKNKIEENKKAFVKDMLQGLKEWREQESPEVLHQPYVDGYSVDREKLEISEKTREHMNKMADEAEKYLHSLVEDETISND